MLETGLFSSCFFAAFSFTVTIFFCACSRHGSTCTLHSSEQRRIIQKDCAVWHFDVLYANVVTDLQVAYVDGDDLGEIVSQTTNGYATEQHRESTTGNYTRCSSGRAQWQVNPYGLTWNNLEQVEVYDAVRYGMELDFLDDAIEAFAVDVQVDPEYIRVDDELGNVQLFDRKVLLLTAAVENTRYAVVLAELVRIFLSYAPT